MNNSNVAPAGGTKYTFVGRRPDFKRIIRENPGADVIIVSREDGLVTFLFSVGTRNKQTATNNTLETLQEEMGFYFQFDYGGVNIQPPHEEYSLPIGWASFATTSDGWIKDLRKLAQRFVALRHGKHTVETLP